ncbi:MAG: FUSC family protein [Bacteriovoracaceae bacterium]|nr:FUSC family protein [Bacteriovoracaceae bacterium]
MVVQAMTNLFSNFFDIDSNKAIHAFRLAAAAWIAFAIAVLFEIPNPYWASMPIWVVAQSSRGLLFERGFYRILGTVVGALIGFGITHFFHSPYIEIILLGFIVAACSGGAHMLRGVQSYGVTLTGITAAIIVLPSVLVPEVSGELAISRVQCTLIGVIVVTLVTAFFTPESPRKEFYRRARDLTADTIVYLTSLLKNESVTDPEIQEAQLLQRLGDIDANAAMVSAGSVEGYQRVQAVNALISAALAVMATGKSIQNYSGNGLVEELTKLSDWLRSEDDDKKHPTINWDSSNLNAHITRRLKFSIDQLIDAAIMLLSSPTSADAKSFGKKFQYLAPHRDLPLAIRASVVAGMATTLTGIIGLLSGWKYGELAAMGVCIFSVVLGTIAQPRLIAPFMLMGALSGALFATLYRIFLQPELSTTMAVIVSVFPFFLLGGFARTNKKTAAAAIDYNMVFLLAGQAGMTASTNVPDILSGASAIVIAVIPVTLSHIFLPRPYIKLAESAKTSIKKDLRELTLKSTTSVEWHGRAGRHILRHLLHLSYGGVLSQGTPRGLLETLNLGYAFTELHTLTNKNNLSELMVVLRRLIEDPVSAMDIAQLASFRGQDPRLDGIIQETLVALDGYKLLFSRE